MNRLEKFKAFKEHAWFCRVYSKLKKSDLEFCFNFLTLNDSLEKNLYAEKVVRLFLDQEKPKNWKEIEELLIASI